MCVWGGFGVLWTRVGLLGVEGEAAQLDRCEWIA